MIVVVNHPWLFDLVCYAIGYALVVIVARALGYKVVCRFERINQVTTSFLTDAERRDLNRPRSPPPVSGS